MPQTHRDEQMIENIEKSGRAFDFFISYYSGTGTAYAKYLKAHARDFERTAFLDSEDIPKNIVKETNEWRFHIDKGIKNSENFVLIMTLGFNRRPEVKRELRKAFNEGKNVFLFKHDDLDANDLIIELEKDIIDLSKKMYVHFSDECDLLAKVENVLRGKHKQEGHPSKIFADVERLISNEGLEIKDTKNPFLEIIVLPNKETKDWLTFEDEDLVNVSPYRDNFSRIRARRFFFELEGEGERANNRPIDTFLRISKNGIFHLIEPLKHDKSYWFGAILNQIAELLLYCVTIMKYKNHSGRQTIFIILKNVSGLELKLSDWQSSYFKWCFSKSDPKPFIAEFDPSNEFKEIGKALFKICRELYEEINYTQISEEQIAERLEDVLISNFYVKYSHNYSGLKHIVIPALKLNDFDLFNKNSEKT